MYHYLSYSQVVALLAALRATPERRRSADHAYLVALFTAELARVHARRGLRSVLGSPPPA